MTKSHDRIYVPSRPALAVVALSLLAFGGLLLPANPAYGQDSTTSGEPERLEDFLQQEAVKTLAQAKDHLEHDPDPAPPSIKTLEAGRADAALKMSSFNCLPTCEETDGKFLAIAGSNLVTLSDAVLELTVAAPANVTSFEIGIFDGDGSELDVAGERRWDTGVTALFSYTLLADPLSDGAGTIPADLDPVTAGVQSVVLSDTMPNDAWIDFTVLTGPDAQAPSGNFFYRFIIEMLDPSLTMLNAFKIRTSTIVTVEPFAQPFSYVANFGPSLTDITLLFPNFPADAVCVPDATRACYDGVFRFFFGLSQGQSDMAIWDGDFDRGNFDGTLLDTDDPNTPGAPFLPPWATPDAVSEGIAIGAGASTGAPPDNRPSAGLGIFQVKEPTVRADLLFPNGQIFPNDNPSGNQEWEQFNVSTSPFDPTVMDFTTSIIPMGTYEFRVEGVDLQNLNAVRLPSSALCVDPLGIPCEPLRPFLVGDTVFVDLDKDGAQGPGEPGVGGVVVNLLGLDGTVITSTTTDSAGNYSFEVNVGTYTLEVDVQNFDSGGALAGLVSTTGGEQIVDSVVDDNVLDYDFGYRGTGTIGDFVWYDANGDGVDDEPSSAGLGGVGVNLTEAGEDGMFGTLDDVAFPPQTTDDDGAYLFIELLDGLYRVDVDESTLPAGVALTTANEPLAVALGPGEDFEDADFGYGGGNGSLGDVVWYDADASGAQDSGEPGLDGVTVALTGDIDGDGTAEIVVSTVTSTVASVSGVYGFGGLPPGSYMVTVDSGTLLPGLDTPTFDADGTGTPDTASLTLADGEQNDTIDFGYAGTGSLGDRVWLDTNGNGLQDDGPTGINGVTVTLVGATTGVTLTAVTSGDGNYSFGNLSAETYTVSVDPATLPTGLAATFDADGLATPNQATAALAAGEDNTAIDFGYGPCNECDGKVTELTLQYLGATAANVEIRAKRGPTTDIVFSGALQPGEEFTITGPLSGNRGFFGTLGTEIRFVVDGQLQTTIHTSCSQPIGPGLVSGDFKVLAGKSRHGGLLCPLDVDPGAPPAPSPSCGCEGKVTELSLQYLGTASASIRVIGKRGSTNDVIFEATVAPNEVFNVTSAPASAARFMGTLGTEIELYVDGPLHTTIHTSCSQPVGPGLGRGDFLVVGGSSKKGGPLCSVDGS